MKSLLLLLFLLAPLVLGALDWRQTRTVARSPGRFAEKWNYVIRWGFKRFPMRRLLVVDAWFGLMALLTVCIDWKAPMLWAAGWNAVCIVVETVCVVHNKRERIPLDL